MISDYDWNGVGDDVELHLQTQCNYPNCLCVTWSDRPNGVELICQPEWLIKQLFLFNLCELGLQWNGWYTQIQYYTTIYTAQ